MSFITTNFQDVSDRVEKAELEDPVLKALEAGGPPVVRGDWRFLIDEEVAKDLRKYRTYRGESVRDLLRALRNKKHHFRELSDLAQANLGETPDQFTNYWLSRFPHLLVQAWLSMQCVANEPTFKQYYHPTHRYPLVDFNGEDYLEDIPVVNQNIDEHFYKKKKEVPVRMNRPYPRSPKKQLSKYKGEGTGLYRNFGNGRVEFRDSDGRNEDFVRITDGPWDGDGINIKSKRDQKLTNRRFGKRLKSSENVSWTIPNDT